VVLQKNGEDQLDHYMRNEVVVRRVMNERNILHTYSTQKVTSCVETTFYNAFFKERGKERRGGKTRKKM